MNFDDSEDENEEIEMSDDDDDYEQIFLQHELIKRRMFFLITLGAALCIQYYMKYLMKRNVRALICSGWQYVIEVLNIGPNKTDPRSETRTKQPGPIPDPTPKIYSPESGPETRIDPNRTIPDPKFSTKLLILE